MVGFISNYFTNKFILWTKLLWTSRSYVKYKPHVIIGELTPSISKRAFDVTKAYPHLQSYEQS